MIYPVTTSSSASALLFSAYTLRWWKGASWYLLNSLSMSFTAPCLLSQCPECILPRCRPCDSDPGPLLPVPRAWVTSSNLSLCRSHITCRWAPQQCAAVFLALGMPQAMSPWNTEKQLFNSTNIYGTPDAEQCWVGTGSGSKDIEGVRDIKAQKTHRQAGRRKATPNLLVYKRHEGVWLVGLVLFRFCTAVFPVPEGATGT